jgi:hypothetical protein
MCDGAARGRAVWRQPSGGFFRLAPEVVAREFPVGQRPTSKVWLVQYLIAALFWSSAVPAQVPVIIGATRQQERFLSCVAQLSADDLRDTPHSNERLTVVILEHQKFLEMREAFHAHKTKLAFSSLEARRIYLSSRVFRDFETLQRCITHELGHFATQSVYEDHAERAALSIRWRVRQTCGSDVR